MSLYMKTSRRLISLGIPSLAMVGLLAISFLLGQKSEASLVSENGQLSCSNEQFTEYNKYMLLAGEMTVARQPDSGTRAQQKKMVDAFEGLTLPKDKTVIAVGHVKTGKVYTMVCESEKCTQTEMAKPEQVCLAENWNDCPYLAMQFREKKYCLLAPANE